MTLRLLLILAVAALAGPDGRVPFDADRPEAPRAGVRRIGARGHATVVTGHLHVPGGTTLEVAGPLRFAAGAALVAAPGATLRMLAGASIHIERTAFIRLVGTAAEPIVLACRDDQGPGCWEGVTIDGFAPINHGTPTSPAARFSTAAGCREAGEPVSRYGGCDAADSSGVMRYVQIRDAFTGLRLRGVGRRTVLDRIQVHHSIGTGVEITGGTADLRYLAATVNGQFGVHWRGGWTGRAQYVVVQQDPAFNAGGVLGQNGFNGTSDDAAPRSNPTISNLLVLAATTVANPYANAPPRALSLERGTAGTLRNLLVFEPRVGLDLDDDATCLQAIAGTLSVRHAVFAGATDLGDPDADPVACAPLGGASAAEAGLLGAPGASIAVLSASQAASLLRGGRDLLLPDFRARPEQIPQLTSVAVLPPADGFFDQRPPEATGLESSEVSLIPWYSGWTVGGALPPTPTVIVTGVVTSALLGTIADARVSITPAGLTTLSNEVGAFTFVGVPGGVASVSVGELPTGCAAVPPQTVRLIPGAVQTLTFTASCTPAPDVAIAGGSRHVCGLDVNGAAWCWGDGTSGQLGGGSTSGSAVPVPVAGGRRFQSISASNGTTCAIDAARQLFCWGDHRTGQLGDGSAVTFATAPVAAGGALRFKAVAVGSEHTCGISTIDDAYCWGSGVDGKLGTGAIEDSSRVPLLVTGGRKWRSISAGGAHSCGITVEGQAFCWGSSVTGALGSPGVAQSATPVAVAAPAGVTFARVDAGESSTCAVTTTGLAYCWGTNVVGQLGVGSTASAGAPVPVTGGLRWRSVAMTAEPSFVTHTCGVTDVAEAWCWGLGNAGQLGQAPPELCTFLVPWGCSRVPRLVPQVPTVDRVVTSLQSTCALTLTGAVWCWGANEVGQLGDGTTISRAVPAPISGTVTWPRSIVP